jgi:DNA-binding transcriptional regulator WhiA
MAGEFKVGHGGVCCLKVHTENLGVARKCFTLLVKTFNIKTDVVVRRNTGKDNYSYYIYAKGYVTRSCRQSAVKGHI